MCSVYLLPATAKHSVHSCSTDHVTQLPAHASRPWVQHRRALIGPQSGTWRASCDLIPRTLQAIHKLYSDATQQSCLTSTQTKRVLQVWRTKTWQSRMNSRLTWRNKCNQRIFTTILIGSITLNKISVETVFEISFHSKLIYST